MSHLTNKQFDLLMKPDFRLQYLKYFHLYKYIFQLQIQILDFSKNKNTNTNTLLKFEMYLNTTKYKYSSV